LKTLVAFCAASKRTWERGRGGGAESTKRTLTVSIKEGQSGGSDSEGKRWSTETMGRTGSSVHLRYAKHRRARTRKVGEKKREEEEKKERRGAPGYRLPTFTLVGLTQRNKKGNEVTKKNKKKEIGPV